jgi:hypothetical protein
LADISIHQGLLADRSGANSLASALHLRDGRDPVENQFHCKTELPSRPSKQDISTLRQIGHFYFALTEEFQEEFQEFQAHKKVMPRSVFLNVSSGGNYLLGLVTSLLL